MTTPAGKVGFIGGMKSDVLETFDWGYQAGDAYANATEGTNVEVVSQYIDQYDLAPENMLTSVMKNVDKAVIEVSTMASEGEEIGGKNIELSAKDGAVGISEHHDLMEPGVYDTAVELFEKIKNGEIEPPATEDAYNDYVATL